MNTELSAHADCQVMHSCQSYGIVFAEQARIDHRTTSHEPDPVGGRSSSAKGDLERPIPSVGQRPSQLAASGQPKTGQPSQGSFCAEEYDSRESSIAPKPTPTPFAGASSINGGRTCFTRRCCVAVVVRPS